jgi:hypothetical protein
VGLLDFQFSGFVWKWDGTGSFCLQEFIVLEHPGGILVAGNLGELMERISGFFLTIFLLALFNFSDSWRRS